MCLGFGNDEILLARSYALLFTVSCLFDSLVPCLYQERENTTKNNLPPSDPLRKLTL